MSETDLKAMSACPTEGEHEVTLLHPAPSGGENWNVLLPRPINKSATLHVQGIRSGMGQMGKSRRKGRKKRLTHAHRE